MSLQKQLSQSATLLSAVDAMRNWRAATLLLGSLLAAGLLVTLGGIVSFRVHAALGAVFFLLAFAIVFYGINAVGIMMMDEAQGAQARPMLSAILTALAIGHRVVLVLLLTFLTYIIGAAIIALVLLICKIPMLGPILFTIVFPVCVVISGLAVFAGYAVIGTLTGPAVWSGATTMQALSRLAAISRQRIVIVILSVLVLLLICGFVGSVLFSILFTGTLITGGMSAGIIGVSGMNMGSVMNIFGTSGSGFGGGDSGHLAAGAFGWGIVMAIAFTLPFLIYLRGLCQLFLANIQGVDVAAIEQQLRGTLDAAKRNAAEIKAKGEALAAQQAQRFEKPIDTQPARPIATAPQLKCAVCAAPYAPGDLFCAGCGHKLT
jgi:hypothetical protein